MRELAPWRSLSGASQAAGSRIVSTLVPMSRDAADTSVCATLYRRDILRQFQESFPTMSFRLLQSTVALAFLAGNGFAFQAGDTVLARLGHSHYGDAFDTGPREKPWAIAGIGEAHFPITTKNPEVQRWFDQGNALLHSFWDYEAERAFRWCLKLEPENAMAYWGLARASMLRGLGGAGRPADMIREALKRKANASEREGLYIEALAAEVLPDPVHDGPAEGDASRQRMTRGKKLLETLCVKYPEDMEARALLALNTMGDSRYGAELMIREILAKQPDHPGAHHYRIHNWDYHEPEQALVSARRYGDIAPAIGHALHMPGHIFSIVGMWNEAAISMDAATRAEKQYMKDRMTFPFNNWNYGHNRNYLSYIQEQLGMAQAAMPCLWAVCRKRRASARYLLPGNSLRRKFR